MPSVSASHLPRLKDSVHQVEIKLDCKAEQKVPESYDTTIEIVQELQYRYTNEIDKNQLERCAGTIKILKVQVHLPGTNIGVGASSSTPRDFFG